MSINDVISVISLIVYVCNKNCKKQKFEHKNCGSFCIYFSFTLLSTLIFHFQQLHFENKILSQIAKIYDG